NAVETGIRVSDDFQPATALVEGNHRVINQLRLVAGAARTLDAALAVQDDDLAQANRLSQLLLLGEVHAPDAFAMAHGQVLQRAFATFVANGAVQRVARQQKFDDVVARFGNFVGGGAHDHPFTDGNGAAGLQAATKINLRGAVLIEDDFTSF